MRNFRLINHDTGFLLLPSVTEWLPRRYETRLAVQVVNRLGLSQLEKSAHGQESASYHSAMLLGLLIYGYATRVFSSRAPERSTYDSVAMRFITDSNHSDHDSMATSCKRFIDPLLVEVLKLARTMGMLKIGSIMLNGIELHEQAECHAELTARDESRPRTNKKHGNGTPALSDDQVAAKEHINLTDKSSRIMPVLEDESNHCYNANAVAAIESLRAAPPIVTLTPNDKEQLESMVGQLKGVPQHLKHAKRILPHSGHLSDDENVEARRTAGIEALIALKRRRHHQIGNGIAIIPLERTAKHYQRAKLGGDELDPLAEVRAAAPLNTRHIRVCATKPRRPDTCDLSRVPQRSSHPERKYVALTCR